MATTAAILAPGEALGGFRIVSVIGYGGMAVVYRADQISLGRHVALKVLAPRLSHDESFRERFRQEGEHAAALDHPNIVSVYDFGESEGRLYLAMRLVEGTTLAERMLQPGVSAQATLDILLPIARALDVAHAQGLVHRDVKPQNILLGRNDHPFLADFGIAKGPQARDLTATGGFLGSLNYAAPEQIVGARITAAADVYALTAVLYQCLTGEVPYPRDTDADVRRAHTEEPPPELDPDTTKRSLNAVIAKGMAKHPSARHRRATELMQHAADALHELPSAARNAVPAFHPAAAARAGYSSVARVAGREGATATPLTIPSPDGQPARMPTARHRRRRPVAFVGGAILIVAATAVALLLVAGAPARAVARSARSGPISVRYLPPWRLTSAPTGPDRGLMTAPVTLVRAGMTLTIGALARSADVPAGAPPQLVASLGLPARASSIRLGPYPARTYTWTREGTGTIAFVMAEAAHDLGLVCRGVHAGAAECLAVARTVTTLGTVEAPGVDAALAVALASDLRPVASERRQGLESGPASARAAAAGELRALNSTAAAALAKLHPPRRYQPLVALLNTALRREAANWSALAAAANRGDRSKYAAAAAAALTGARAMASAVAKGSAYGFRLAAPPAFLAAGLSRAKWARPPKRNAPTGGSANANSRAHSATGTQAPTVQPQATPAQTTPTQTTPTQTTPTQTTPAGGRLVPAQPLS